MTTARTVKTADDTLAPTSIDHARSASVAGNGHLSRHGDASTDRAIERLKLAVRAGNHLDHREVEVHDVEVRFRDGDGQAYRIDLNHPEMLRRILRSDVAEPLANFRA